MIFPYPGAFIFNQGVNSFKLIAASCVTTGVYYHWLPAYRESMKPIYPCFNIPLMKMAALENSNRTGYLTWFNNKNIASTGG
jgi:hypothetical protein